MEYGERNGGREGEWPDVLGHPHPTPGRQGPDLPPGEVQGRAVGGACGHTRAGALPLRLAQSPSSARSPTQLRKAPVTNKRARDFMRMLFAGASAETADKQGRVTLPPMLRDYAGLQPRVRRDRRRSTGSRSGTPTAWNTYSAEQEPAFADWSEEVLPGDRTSSDRRLARRDGLRTAPRPRWHTFPGARRDGARSGTWAGRTGRAPTPAPRRTTSHHAPPLHRSRSTRSHHREQRAAPANETSAQQHHTKGRAHGELGMGGSRRSLRYDGSGKRSATVSRSWSVRR